jgi:hypothetical protein
MQIFFGGDKFPQAVTEFSARVEAVEGSEVLQQLSAALVFMMQHPKAFDELCQVSISTFSPIFIQRIVTLRAPYPLDQVELLSAIVYRFATEFDLSTAGDIPAEIRQFMNSLEDRRLQLNQAAQNQLDYAQRGLPIAILKRLLNADDFKSLRDIEGISKMMEEKVQGWNNALEVQEKNANRLGELFEKHANNFNFSGLHSGFSDMAANIKRELLWSQVGMAVFGALTLLPGLFDLYLAFVSDTDFAKWSQYNLIAAGLGTLTLTLLFLYFFRIALRKADSCRAQLLQISLRMSLCRFIQPYTDYSKEVREKSPDTFSKFEALIFSGIAGTNEKIPTTFDALEQMGAFAKSLRGKD